MSGHSKWATIKHKKAATDAKRGKQFTRIIKEIMIAARNGGDPDMNPRLRTAVTAAKAVSMPSDNIKKAIMRGTGELEGGLIEEIMFEGYGPGGSAVLVMAATDNRNRTVSEVRHMFSKNGGNLGEQGSVAWMFERKSQILIAGDKAVEDQLMGIVLDAGADDLRDDGGTWDVLSPPEAHEAVLAALAAAKIPTESAEIAMVPKNLVKVEGKNAAAMIRMSEALEDHEDIQNFYSNFDIDDSEMEALDRMRVLGIDCGVERTGYGVIESDGRAHRLLASGVIRTSTRAPLEIRLLKIAEGLREAIGLHTPAEAAVEGIFHSVNIKTTLKLAHVRGIVLLVAAEAGLSMGEYSPLEVKSSVVGYGRAEKSQVQVMVRSLLGLETIIESEDACDAVAVAICHANRTSTARMLAKAVS